jgi:2-polyprenyl-6-methoxyphenol hydroxylase-like FAD-dependent oxidoreductase
VHALVVGGGIAGTTTAIALAKAGIDATVHEAHDRDSEGVGGWLTLASNGIDALATLGLGAEVTAHGHPTRTMRLSNHTGRVLAEFPMAPERPDGLKVHTVRRCDLHRVLRAAATARAIPVRFGKRLVDATPRPGGGVIARFADGDHVEADLLVGADGLRSAVRTIIDPAAPAARYTGLLNTGGYATGATLPPRFRADPGVIEFCFGRNCFLGYTLAPDSSIWWFANPAARQKLGRAELAAISEDDWRRRLHALFAGDELPAATLVDGSAHIFAGWNTYDFPTVRTWHRDDMIIVGDAAHAASPASGQGASMAIEDAVTLARCLRDSTSVPAAFAGYESLRRARVEKVVEQGRRNGTGKTAGPIARVIRDRVIMPMVASRAARTGASPSEWLFGHHIDWETPVRATPRP